MSETMTEPQPGDRVIETWEPNAEGPLVRVTRELLWPDGYEMDPHKTYEVLERARPALTPDLSLDCETWIDSVCAALEAAQCCLDALFGALASRVGLFPQPTPAEPADLRVEIGLSNEAREEIKALIADRSQSGPPCEYEAAAHLLARFSRGDDAYPTADIAEAAEFVLRERLPDTPPPAKIEPIGRVVWDSKSDRWMSLTTTRLHGSSGLRAGSCWVAHRGDKAMKLYKATRPDGTDFRTGTVHYKVGEVTTHPAGVKPRRAALAGPWISVMGETPQ